MKRGNLYSTLRNASKIAAGLVARCRTLQRHLRSFVPKESRNFLIGRKIATVLNKNGHGTVDYQRTSVTARLTFFDAPKVAFSLCAKDEFESLQMSLKFFSRAELFRNWLTKYHQTQNELIVGYYKKDSGKASMTWPESVDEALCFGWIDGIRRRIDETSYSIRFTPRKKSSVWSKINIGRAEALIGEGRMTAAGQTAFDARVERRSGIYCYEQMTAELDEQYAVQLKLNKAAWSFYHTQSASYRKAVNWWVCSAKQEVTRQRRLQQLIEDCADGQKIKQFRRE